MRKTDKRSRYRSSTTITTTDSSGRPTELLELRDIPAAEGVLELVTTATDRLDLLAHRFYRDATAFWRLCDASDHLDPTDVVVPNGRVVVPPRK
ncbi:MAG: hypothetical protein MUC56_14100 [Thermoanaerobaculales bacterium]|nr:hypothetical protein [Thermoanaerobaculales bacterium]